MKNILKLACSCLMFILISCGGGGDNGDDSASDDVCALKIFNGELCDTATDSVVEIIFKDSSGQPAALCSGTVIAPNAVLTAAHCFDLTSGGLDVISGGVNYSVSGFRRHPAYNSADNLTPFDVAVVFTEQPLAASPIAVRSSRAPSSGESIRIFGYGQDESGRSLFEQGIRGTGPKAAESEVVNSGDGIFVAGNPSKGVCSGDSGGPAIVGGNDPRIAGVAQAGAFVEGCSDSILTRQEIEQIRGRPFSEAEFQSLLPFSQDGGKTFAVNFYSDLSFPAVTAFITAVVPAVELR